MIERRRVELHAMIAAETRLRCPPSFRTWRQSTSRRSRSSPPPSRTGWRAWARETLRGFIDRIIIPPGDGFLEVRRDLGQMLAAAAGERARAVLGAVVIVGCGGGI